MKLQKFEWIPELQLGVNEMDHQHQNIVKKINTLIDALEAKKDILPKFDDLAKYTVEHFSEEEKYMESMNYPEITIHKEIHKQLLAKVALHREDIEKGEVNEFKLINFLNMWLRSHIMGIDKKYGNFAHSKNHVA